MCYVCFSFNSFSFVVLRLCALAAACFLSVQVSRLSSQALGYKTRLLPALLTPYVSSHIWHMELYHSSGQGTRGDERSILYRGAPDTVSI